jgi:hypothetical protein
MSVASVGNITRSVAVLAACVAAAGSATSSSNRRASAPGPDDQNSSPPPAQQMDGARALGLWQSTFGAVKLEADSSQGGLGAGNVHGVWVYDRQGQEVVGYFSGNLRGNVLQFHWQEPNNPPLTGEGFLVFDVQGRQYSGRWWSDKRDRVGDWRGWRPTGGQPAEADPGAYGDAAPSPSPYRRPQPYQRQPQPYRQPQPPSPYQDPQQAPPPPPPPSQPSQQYY